VTANIDQIDTIFCQGWNKVAILVDGTFFLKRYFSLHKDTNSRTPENVAKKLCTLAHDHSKDCYLYRIFYYDSFPYDKKLHNPISKQCIDFSKTSQYTFRIKLYEELKQKRKVALRLGYLKDNHICKWEIKKDKLSYLLNKTMKWDELTENDVMPDLQQKGVDIRIGLDIASLAYKKLVNKIVLISGDSDFVPAAKVARREGIDFVLDPLWSPISPDLFEHIDGLKSYWKKPEKKPSL
jgi:uncharacterized LabA/DUF88 family protein